VLRREAGRRLGFRSEAGRRGLRIGRAAARRRRPVERGQADRDRGRRPDFCAWSSRRCGVRRGQLRIPCRCLRLGRGVSGSGLLLHRLGGSARRGRRSCGRLIVIRRCGRLLGPASDCPRKAEILQLARADRLGGRSVGRRFGRVLRECGCRPEREPGRRNRHSQAQSRPHLLPFLCVIRADFPRRARHMPP
jgi:hypothetical protein